MSKPAIAYEAPVIKRSLNPGSSFARPDCLGERTKPKPPKPLPYEIRDGVPLLELAPGSCRWPVGDPRAGLFCGCRKATPSRPYCEEHAARGRLRVVTDAEVDALVKMVQRLDRAGRARG